MAARALLTVGRVQTPTLAIVVARTARSSRSVRVLPQIRALVQALAATSPPPGRRGGSSRVDSEGRLVDTVVADALVSAAKGQPGTIAGNPAGIQEAKPAAGFSPVRHHGPGVGQVWLQRRGAERRALYGRTRLTSYPRTDCARLPESQHADAPSRAGERSRMNPELAGLVEGTDPRIKSRTWDDSKITAHHGIVPTMHRAARRPSAKRGATSTI